MYNVIVYNNHMRSRETCKRYARYETACKGSMYGNAGAQASLYSLVCCACLGAVITRARIAARFVVAVVHVKTHRFHVGRWAREAYGLQKWSSVAV